MRRASGKIIAILYPGELGARVGAALVARGEKVITTLEGRGAETRRRCEESGIAVRPTFAQVVREADVILSLVPPAAAEEVARDYASLAHLAPPHALFVDVNSIRPALAVELCRLIEAADRGFVDGTINGLASRFSDGGTLFLSGARAGEVAELFDGATRLQLLGLEPGSASAMKMMLSGISKGVCALFVELALTARRQGILNEMLTASSQIYPEVTNLVHRMLPTYAQHADRRAEEMRQLEATVRDSGTDPLVTGALRELHEQLARVGRKSDMSGGVVALIELLAKAKFQAMELAGRSEEIEAVSLKE